MKTPEAILHGARGVLERRGRTKGVFAASDGRIDQLAALAIAAGFGQEAWMVIRTLEFEDLSRDYQTLVEAARLLAGVEAPLQPVREMSLERLVMLLGDANDVISDGQAAEFLAKAAALAGQAREVSA